MFRFTIKTLDNPCTPSGLVIGEPVGWDAIVFKLKRDKVWRGFFDFFDDSYASLQFDFKTSPLPGGGQLLKEVYDAYGIEAKAYLVVEYTCSDTDGFEIVYTGQFAFGRYKFTCSDVCFVECGVEN